MQPKLQGVFLVRAYVDLVDGDIPAALMFSQIAYWHGWGEKGKSKLRVIRDGIHWLAKSAPDWNAETGLSEKQATRSTQVLINKGLIQKKVMKFNGSPTVHIRLTSAGEAALKCQSGNSHLASKEDAFALAGKSLTETTTENTTETTTDSAGKPAEEMDTQKHLGKNSQEEKKWGKYESALGKHWREQMAIKYPGYQKVLTKKEYGQLKHFGDKVSNQAEEAIIFAIQNWSTFTYKTQFDKGTIAPGTPVIGFLLKYCDALVMLMESECKKKLEKAKWEAEAKVKAEATAKANAKYAEENKPMTQEEKDAAYQKWLASVAEEKAMGAEEKQK